MIVCYQIELCQSIFIDMTNSNEQPVFSKVSTEEAKLLSEVSAQTFSIAFSHLNTKANMASYLKEVLNQEQLAQELKNTSSQFFFLSLKGTVKGYLKINLSEAQTEDIDPNAIEIQRIYLYPDAQGQGYGKLMINYAEEIGLKHSCPMIWLGVWEKNTNSIAFYERMGYRIFDKHDFPFGDEIQTDLLMKKNI